MEAPLNTQRKRTEDSRHQSEAEKAVRGSGDVKEQLGRRERESVQKLRNSHRIGKTNGPDERKRLVRTY